MEKLKPCPHCGGEAALIQERSGKLIIWRGSCEPSEGCAAQTDGFYVNDAQTADEAKQAAIAAWNRRTPDWRKLAQELATELRLSSGPLCRKCEHNDTERCHIHAHMCLGEQRVDALLDRADAALREAGVGV